VIRIVLRGNLTIRETICGQWNLASPVLVFSFLLTGDNDMRQGIVVLVITFLPLPSPAGEPIVRPGDSELIQQMQRRIDALEKRIAELELQLATPHASGQTSDTMAVPWYRQHRLIPTNARVVPVGIDPSVIPSTKGCVEKGMRASEIEHRTRMETYLNNPGLEPLDPTWHQWPLRSFR
jgi:hypothetical protein